MLLSFYYEYSWGAERAAGGATAAPKRGSCIRGLCPELLCTFLDARSVAFLDVEACSKAILALCSGHGKSPCFSRYRVLKEVGVDEGALVLAVVDGGFFLD